MLFSSTSHKHIFGGFFHHVCLNFLLRHVIFLEVTKVFAFEALWFSFVPTIFFLVTPLFAVVAPCKGKMII
ncbi:hypothetical protein Sjap_019676 [Stephania japonica]|uniref:Uncharacterized protein n=1 Tax=Stephania japonica TaxID=461633 RepID=A0AAP0F4Q7_9MAGN